MIQDDEAEEFNFDLNVIAEEDYTLLAIDFKRISLSKIVLVEIALNDGRIIKVQPSDYFVEHQNVIPFRFNEIRDCKEESIKVRAYYLKNSYVVKTNWSELSSRKSCNLQNINRIFYL